MIGRGDEQDVRRIEFQHHAFILEGSRRLRLEQIQQNRFDRVAEVAGDFIDFVQENDRSAIDITGQRKKISLQASLLCSVRWCH